MLLERFTHLTSHVPTSNTLHSFVKLTKQYICSCCIYRSLHST